MNIITPDQRITEIWMQIKDPRTIRKLMLIQGISQRDMCSMIGWKSHSYLGRILRGEIKSIEPAPAARLAAVLGVGMDDLFVSRVSTVDVRSDSHREAS